MAEGIVTVANLGGILVELNYVLHDLVSVMHPEMFEGILGISNGIKSTKVGLEFVKECSVRVLPCQWILLIWAEDVWFKPVESGAREKRNGVVDFTGIHHKSSGSVIKVQLKGDNESFEFPWVRAVKSIRFFNLGVDVVGSRVVYRSGNPAQQIHEFPQDVLLVGRIVAKSARTSRTTGAAGAAGTARATWSFWSVRAARSSWFIWAAWLGVIIFITIVALVCSMSESVSFAPGVIRFCGGWLPLIGCGWRCWGVWIQALPVSIEYTSPSVTWKVIWWRSAKRIRRTVMVGLSGSELE